LDPYPFVAMHEGWRDSRLPGVIHRTLTVNSDPRGSFSELWRESWTSGLGLRFRQANMSVSGTGVLRAMHFHLRQADLWVVVDGRAFVALCDLRSALGDDNQPTVTDTFEVGPGDVVLIPPGVAHGFLALESLRLAYLVSTEYDGTDEHGFAWDDAEASISWPTREPILSDRDRGNPSLAEALVAARGSTG
jgi:dTDP-4-dehydrorhamnose 3,5-epimerase